MRVKTALINSEGITAFFSLSEEDKDIASNEITSDNIKRAISICTVGVVISFLHAFLFWYSLDSAKGIEWVWRSSISKTHGILFFSFTIIGLFIYRQKRKQNLWMANFGVYFLVFLFLIAGVSIATIDQLVTPAITPYMICCLIVALAFYIRPLHALLFFIAVYVFFYLMIPHGQLNIQAVVSNRVNAISITTISVFLSFILWMGNLKRIKQSRLIIKQNQLLIENNIEKDKFFSIIAHDLRSPLAGFSQVTDTLVRNLEIYSAEEKKELVQNMHYSAQNMYNLLDNLLKWAMLKRGLITISPAWINVRETIMTSLDLYTDLLGKKGLKLTIQIPADVEIYSDANQIQLIVRNLLSNAIKFSKKGAEIIIALVRSDQEECMFLVQDSGCGMSKERQAGLFSLGGVNSEKGTEGEKGNGLGLLLCKEFVEKLGGSIWVESDLNKGSRFYFSVSSKYSIE